MKRQNKKQALHLCSEFMQIVMARGGGGGGELWGWDDKEEEFIALNNEKRILQNTRTLPTFDCFAQPRNVIMSTVYDRNYYFGRLIIPSLIKSKYCKTDK